MINPKQLAEYLCDCQSNPHHDNCNTRKFRYTVEYLSKKHAEHPPVSASPAEPPKSKFRGEIYDPIAYLEGLLAYLGPKEEFDCELIELNFCIEALKVRLELAAASPVAVDCSGGPRCPKCGRSWPKNHGWFANVVKCPNCSMEFVCNFVSDFAQLFRPVAARAPQVEDDHSLLTTITWSRSRRENG